MRIAIFNVRYSPNLGDGLLSECLERELEAALPGIDIIGLDLAGRSDFSAPGSGRQIKLQILERLPGPLRALSARLALEALARYRLRPAWQKALAKVDAVVIGGGNLLADADLNFPIKIGAALQEANRRKLPVCIYGVGATDNWSKRGARLFGRGLKAARLVTATVRDERSLVTWNKRLTPFGVRPAALAYDPGLLACRHYSAQERLEARRVVGLCITAPIAIRYHSDIDVGADRLGAWYGSVAGAFAERGWTVKLFTNGSPEDQAFLAQGSAEWSALSPNVQIVPAFDKPADLAGFASGCNVMVAHRMHACIAAYSFGVPPIGLAWDKKVDSFFELAGMSQNVVTPGAIPAEGLVDLAVDLERDGLDKDRYNTLIERCRQDVAALGAALRAAVV